MAFAREDPVKCNFLLWWAISSRPSTIEKIDVILLDFSKAFDKVPHHPLFTKLESYRIGGPVLCWITSFLQNRTQRVVVEDARQTWKE